MLMSRLTPDLSEVLCTRYNTGGGVSIESKYAKHMSNRERRDRFIDQIALSR